MKMDVILLVEDDAAVSEGLRMSLKIHGYEVIHAPSLAQARAVLKKSEIDLLVLDVNLPDGMGYDLCRELREQGKEMPILMLTARADEDSAVKGLSSGATDYVRKPFGERELLARIQLALNREVRVTKWVSLGKLKIDCTSRRAIYADTTLKLTNREIDILILLVKRAGGLVSRESILSHIDDEGNVFDQTLAAHVSNLRTKLREVAGDEISIQGIYGQGYRINRK